MKENKKKIFFFVRNGYFKFKLNKFFFRKVEKILKNSFVEQTKEKKIDLKKIHKILDINSLNEKRFKIFNKLKKNEEFIKYIFLSAENEIYSVVGNEISSGDPNISIQLPNDKSSVLDMHTDFFSGESLFQVNLWIPMMNVKKTQSMFIISPEISKEIIKKIKNKKNYDFELIKKRYQKHLNFLSVNHGEAILFSPNCLHGNVVNNEKNSRVSINIRFKNLFSPHNNLNNEKRIGTFYKPFKLRAVTNFNLKYNFDEIINND